MFKINNRPTFKRKVTVRIPVDDGYDDQSFTAEFQLLDMDDMGGHNTMTPEGMRSFLQTVVIGLEDIVGEDDKPIPYSAKLRDRVIAQVPALNALYDTYAKAVGDARAGN